MIQAIQTRYNGYHFRSRLEARWAVFFDALGIEWTYESEGYVLPDGTRYLPDFKITAQVDSQLIVTFVEIKGTTATEEEMRKAKILARESGSLVLVYEGDPLECRIHRCGALGWYHPPVMRGDLDLLAFDCWGFSGYNGSQSRTQVQRAAVAARSARFEHGARR